MKELGFVRVVLARELSLEEIRSIAKRCGVEIETFEMLEMQQRYEKITDAEKEAAEKLLPILNGDVSTVLEAYNQLAGQTQVAGYDLRDEAWDTTTLYVIRTDFN